MEDRRRMENAADLVRCAPALQDANCEGICSGCRARRRTPVGSPQMLQIREGEIPLAAGSWRIRETTGHGVHALPWDQCWVLCICQLYPVR